MEYNFSEIEQRAKAKWARENVYKVSNDSDKPKCYVLDMFPYPSGAGLHVGHPLGYIASDIYSRYKRLKGYNVLHPMGFDAFGLPAEQYAIETGQHPAETTEQNIARYREQLDNIGFCYDWSREVRTSDPDYYKWTQWIFLQLFRSWYDRAAQKARPVTELEAIFAKEGNANNVCPADETLSFTAERWNAFSEKEKRNVLMQYRIAYQGYAQVWWCEALGTVLANDEVVNGVSERGGHPVERKNMRQWFLRITEYADRLLTSLDTLDWSDAMKEMQRNWIGKSLGAEIKFYLSPSLSEGEGKVAQARGEKPGWNTAEPSMYGLIGSVRAELKKDQTEAEQILWQHLRANQLGAKFRRQHVIGRFIADFVCLTARLVVEVDGKIHEQRAEQDALRSEYLAEKGFKVIRFTNQEVVGDTDNVVERIKDELRIAENAGVGNTSLSFGEGRGEVSVTVFTTRPDTIFGVDFMVLAPEHELVSSITTAEQKEAVDKYIHYVKTRSERERMADTKHATGCFTGAYAVHPFTGRQIPVWISEYVLVNYGTGAIMAVPSGDDRDHAFAKHFEIPVTNIFGERYTGKEAYSDKLGVIENSGFISGMSIADAAVAVTDALVEKGIGKKKINYKLRDAGFSRQRYWGEPFPIVYVDNIPYGTDEALLKGTDIDSLPVELPHVESYGPGPEGQGPLANIAEWVNTSYGKRETNTMPGYAGSSWYFLRYADPHNQAEFASRKATDYWNQVDLYIGGTEHAVGHLLYSRMWTKCLYDLGYIGFDEPYKKLLNQGMIQGSSRFVYRLELRNLDGSPIDVSAPVFVSARYNDKYAKKEITLKEFMDIIIEQVPHFKGYDKNSIAIAGITRLHVDVNIVDGLELDMEAFKKWRPAYANAEFVTEADGKFICTAETEKMSKGKYNVVNPDDIVANFGADTFRMYEMFLGPIDISKPWDTKGIEGVHRFLKKLWRLYTDEQTGWIVTDEVPTEAELRTLHKTIKKIGEDIERFSFNTSVSQFMICVNELSGCHKRAILEPLAITICPFAPHMAEELWMRLGHTTTVLDASFPQYEERYVAENTKKYPIAVNGKTRTEMEFALDAEQAFVEQEVLADAAVQKWLEGKSPKKFIYVKGKMINVVV